MCTVHLVSLVASHVTVTCLVPWPPNATWTLVSVCVRRVLLGGGVTSVLSTLQAWMNSDVLVSHVHIQAHNTIGTCNINNY